MTAMRKKRIYVAPIVEVDYVISEGHLCVNTGLPNSDQNEWGGVVGKKNKWNTWDDGVDNVGTSAGTGNSPLELPSGGKLWGD